MQGQSSRGWVTSSPHHPCSPLISGPPRADVRLVHNVLLGPKQATPPLLPQIRPTSLKQHWANIAVLHPTCINDSHAMSCEPGRSRRHAPNPCSLACRGPFFSNCGNHCSRQTCALTMHVAADQTQQPAAARATTATEKSIQEHLTPLDNAHARPD